MDDTQFSTQIKSNENPNDVEEGMPNQYHTTLDLFSYNHPVGFVDQVDFHIVVIVDQVAWGCNNDGAGGK